MKSRVFFVLLLLFLLMYSGYKIISTIFYPVTESQSQSQITSPSSLSTNDYVKALVSKTDEVAFRDGVNLGVESLMFFVKQGKQNIEREQIYAKAIEMRKGEVK